MTIRGADVVTEARRWLGTPWQHQAFLRGVACDCIGLVGGVAAAVGASRSWVDDRARKFRGYGRSPDPEMIGVATAELLLPLGHWENAQPGDVLLMRFVKYPQHFAILSSRGDDWRIIHAYEQAGEVVENIIDAKWRRRMVRAFRIPNVEP